MKVMVRVGQLKWNKDGVPAGGRGGRRRIGSRGCARRKVVFLFVYFFCFEFKTRNRVFGLGRMGALGKWGK